MTDQSNSITVGLRGARAFYVLGGIVAIELLLLSVLYKHAIDFDCHATLGRAFCAGGSTMVLRALCIFGMLVLFYILRPAPVRALVAHAGRVPNGLVVNLVGFAVMLIPLTMLRPDMSPSLQPAIVAIWALGALLGAIGALLYLAPLTPWKALLRDQGRILAPLVAIGWFLPALARLPQGLWYQVEAITNMTFKAVATLLSLIGYDVQADPKSRIIGANEFFVDVGKPCSGIEGFALVVLFLSIYFVMFRRELRFPQVLILYPIGILISGVFNILRITVLLIFGIEGNPELAIGGFHSHAGWLLFLTLAIGLVLIIRQVPWFQKQPETATAAQPPRQVVPLFRDENAARILPFAIFMFSAVLMSTLSQNPSELYPFRVLLVGAVLAGFWPYLRTLEWRIDPLAVLAGLGIGVAWIALSPPSSGGPLPYGPLSGALLGLWIVFRGIGTIVLVPVLEELFFRDYLEGKIQRGPGLGWSILAIAVSAGVFAALHGKWELAFAAGVIFSLLYRRQGRICDAIVAHAAANVTVFAAAFVTGNYALI